MLRKLLAEPMPVMPNADMSGVTFEGQLLYDRMISGPANTSGGVFPLQKVDNLRRHGLQEGAAQEGLRHDPCRPDRHRRSVRCSI